MVIEQDVAETVVEPVDPFDRSVGDGFDAAPWYEPVDRVGFVKGR